jgi:thiamine biosynthesis lipoprotein
MAATLLRDHFRAMGSKVVVEVADGTPGHLSLARDRLAFLEARWSRFRAQSDLSRLNASQGDPVVVDESTIELLEAMVHGFTLTDGSFDPTLLAPLVRLGYAASVHDAAAVTVLPLGVQRRGHIRGLVVDLNHMTVRLPPGTAVDAGGIGKGLAADMVAGLLIANGAGGVMVDVGGDVRVMGDGPFDGQWRISVDAAFEPEEAAMGVLVTRGALGSSGTLRRSWVNHDGQPAHHLLDPDRVAPTPSGFDAPVHATVLAATAVEAEMLATMCIVRGAQSALPRLQTDGLGARIVDGSGRTYTNGAWESVVTTDPP